MSSGASWRVAQVGVLVGLEHAAGDGRLVAAAGETYWPFLPITIAVPVSWQPGSTPPAAMLAFLQQLERHEAVVGRGLGVVEDGASWARWPGRSRWAMSRMAWRVSRVSASGSTCRKRLPGGLEGRDALGGEEPVGGLVGPEREHVVDELGHGSNGTSLSSAGLSPARATMGDFAVTRDREVAQRSVASGRPRGRRAPGRRSGRGSRRPARRARPVHSWPWAGTICSSWRTPPSMAACGHRFGTACGDGLVVGPVDDHRGVASSRLGPPRRSGPGMTADRRPMAPNPGAVERAERDPRRSGRSPQPARRGSSRRHRCAPDRWSGPLAARRWRRRGRADRSRSGGRGPRPRRSR